MEHFKMKMFRTLGKAEEQRNIKETSRCVVGSKFIDFAWEKLKGGSSKPSV
jgi:hypothetical protein